jgi:hypothetical protein
MAPALAQIQGPELLQRALARLVPRRGGREHHRVRGARVVGARAEVDADDGELLLLLLPCCTAAKGADDGRSQRPGPAHHHGGHIACLSLSVCVCLDVGGWGWVRGCVDDDDVWF